MKLGPQMTFRLESGRLTSCLQIPLKVTALSMTFDWWYKFYPCFDWKRECCDVGFATVCIDVPIPKYCDETKGNIFKWTAATYTTMLKDECKGSSLRPPPQAPKAVRLRQVDTSGVVITWDPCMGTSNGAPRHQVLACGLGCVTISRLCVSASSGAVVSGPKIGHAEDFFDQSAISFYEVCLHTAGGDELLPCTNVGLAQVRRSGRLFTPWAVPHWIDRERRSFAPVVRLAWCSPTMPRG